MRKLRPGGPAGRSGDLSIRSTLAVRHLPSRSASAYVSGEEIFSDYAYFSSYSDSWVAHAKRYAEAMIGRLGLTRDSLVTEVASNDGYLLQHFKAADIPVLGVGRGRERGRGGFDTGIPTEVQFLGVETGRQLRSGTAGPTWWPRTMSSPMCRISGVSRQACVRWPRTTAGLRWNSRTCCGS